jgi:acetone carboxylase gamma subunit
MKGQDKKILFPIGDSFQVIESSGEKKIECLKCGYVYGAADKDPKANSRMMERPVTFTSSLNGYGMADRFVIREFYCPQCGLLIAANTQLKEDPPFMEMSLSI